MNPAGLWEPEHDTETVVHDDHSRPITVQVFHDSRNDTLGSAYLDAQDYIFSVCLKFRIPRDNCLEGDRETVLGTVLMALVLQISTKRHDHYKQ